MQQWYVIQVANGAEDATAQLVSRMIPAGPELSECFYPRYVTEIKARGSWHQVEKPLFPGYLVGVSESPLELEARLTQIPEFARVLMTGGVPTPLAREERELIDCLTRPGRRVVPMSTGVKVGDEVVITEGPLLGHEGLIRDVNRHKSTAFLEVDLCGRKVGARVGLAILSAANAPEARAAAARTRAASTQPADPRRPARREAVTVSSPGDHARRA